MSLFETYFFLFTDSFVTGLVLPVKRDLVFSAMLIFGGYNLYIASFVATVAITLAACVNWVLGRALRTLKKYQPGKKEASPKVEEVLVYLGKYGCWVALFGFIPILGPILTLFIGVVQSSFTRAVALIFFVNLLWHLFLVM